MASSLSHKAPLAWRESGLPSPPSPPTSQLPYRAYLYSTSGLYNNDLSIINMSAAAGRMASKVGGAAKAVGKAAQSGDQKTGFLQKGAKRDPELYVCSESIKRPWSEST